MYTQLIKDVIALYPVWFPSVMLDYMAHNHQLLWLNFNSGFNEIEIIGSFLERRLWLAVLILLFLKGIR